MDHQGIWILAEQTGGRITPVSHELLTRGLDLAAQREAELTALVFGGDLNADDLQELIDRGADHVLAVEAPQLEHFLVEPFAACMKALIEQRKPEIIIAAATSTGRTLMPYVAIGCHAGLTADCTVLDIDPETGNLLQTRPAIGGNILATIQTPDHRPQMATVRPKSTRPAPRRPGRTGRIERIGPPVAELTSRIRRVDFVPSEEGSGIGEADVVVAVGRGVKKADNLPVAQELAAALGGALGASRDVVDRGWMSYPHQIGLSGKTVTPKLYIGLGVSGSIQHLAGMQTAETIVAVNTDPDAQIFQVADFGIVGDMMEVAPALREAVTAARAAETTPDA
jgi:electron transfer flavoprotein alpha subunit